MYFYYEMPKTCDSHVKILAETFWSTFRSEICKQEANNESFLRWYFHKTINWWREIQNLNWGTCEISRNALYYTQELAINIGITPGLINLFCTILIIITKVIKNPSPDIIVSPVSHLDHPIYKCSITINIGAHIHWIF